MDVIQRILAESRWLEKIYSGDKKSESENEKMRRLEDRLSSLENMRLSMLATPAVVVDLEKGLNGARNGALVEHDSATSVAKKHL
ncbi:hypothetical protein HDU93_007598 [Gonapodya sp. JEL0774]|nr:hypothetical protein HDU93_007598 [Gonapodya sp. JEL0774]